MDSVLLRNCLQLWDQAGERPYEVLKEENLYDVFLDHIKNIEVDDVEHLYRGTKRHSDLNIGDKISYTYPSSWSSSYNNAKNFVDEENIKVIIKLNVSNNKLFGIYNDYNSYDEKEYIMYPFTLTITNKYVVNNVIVFEC